MKKKQNHLLEKIMVPIVEPVVKKIDNLDFRYYASFQNEIKSEIEKKFDDIDFEETKKTVDEFIKTADFKEIFEKIKIDISDKRNKLIKEDEKSAQILDLFEKADEIIPNVSFAVLTRIDIMEHIRKMFEPIDLIEDIERYKGEHRARLAVRLFREVVELLYDNYVRILWELTSILKDYKKIKSTGNFGVLVNGLTKRLEKENKIGLIEKDASWIRNSASHAKYFYNVENDTLIMWDRNKPKKEIKVSDLIDKAISMYHISANVIFDIYIYYTLKMILNSEIVDLIIKEKEKIITVENDNDVSTKIEIILMKQFEQIGQLNFERE